MSSDLDTNLLEDEFIKEVYSILPSDEESWKLFGAVDRNKEVHSFGDDSKIIGRLFEIIAESYLKQVAEKLQLELSTPSGQTIYPDFIFNNPDTNKKIALDVKTTYRQSDADSFSFTGGSFTSYLRDGEKNIEGEYKDYEKHYILGIVYKRTKDASTGKFSIDELENIIPAYHDVEFFVQEKYKIIGESKGSGNTDNMGTVSYKQVEDFKLGKGPFAFLGHEVYEDYWRNYPKNTEINPVKTRIKREKSEKGKIRELTKEEKKKIEEDNYTQAFVTGEIKFLNLEQYIQYIKKSDPGLGTDYEQKYNEYKKYWKSKK